MVPWPNPLLPRVLTLKPSHHFLSSPYSGVVLVSQTRKQSQTGHASQALSIGPGLQVLEQLSGVSASVTLQVSPIFSLLVTVSP